MAKCWRIQGIPGSWDRKLLLEFLQGPGNPLENSGLNGSPEFFKNISANESKHIPLPYTDSGDYQGDLLIDCHFEGLTPLNSPGRGENVVDVIAVTGLAGHAFGSWVNRTSRRMWLQDFLPQDVKNIRIMTYGYNTNLIGDTVSDRILDYRRSLIQQIDIIRDTPEKRKRPIIFIGHSFGGILILQALIQSKSTQSVAHILNSTRAIFFFGTPHAGLEVASLEEMVKDSSPSIESTRLELIRKLREDSEFLENQRDELVDIWAGRRIFSFYETVETPTVQKSASGRYERTGEPVQLVRNVSSMLFSPSENRYPVPENHTNMVKFLTAEDKTYQTVASCLNTCVNEYFAASIKEEILRDLRSFDCESVLERLYSKRHQDTCDWILEDESFKTWEYSQGPSILWIYGDPGSGKSILLSHLIKVLTNKTHVHPRGKHCILAYFFCDDRDEGLKTADAILRNFLDQALRQDPKLVRLVSTRHTELRQKGTKWTLESLWPVFEMVVKNTKRVVFLLDALDECERAPRHEFLKRFSTLFQSFQDTDKDFKMIITSRPHIKSPEKLVSDHIYLGKRGSKADIKSFIQSKLDCLTAEKALSANLRAKIEQKLLNDANGMFLWVSLILQELSAHYGTSEKDILKQLNSFPNTLPEFYGKILSQINGKWRKRALKTLQCIIFATRPLTIKELSVAIAVNEKHETIMDLEEDMENNLEEHLRSLFGPLIKVDRSTVYLAHQSVKDFLIDAGLMGKSNSHSPTSRPNLDSQPARIEDLHCSASESNLQLSVICLDYLYLIALLRLLIPSRLILRELEYPFLLYAEKNLALHTSRLDPQELENPSLLSSFRKLAECLGRNRYQSRLLAIDGFSLYYVHFVLAAFAKDFLVGKAEVRTPRRFYCHALDNGISIEDKTVFEVLEDWGFGAKSGKENVLEIVARYSTAAVFQTFLGSINSIGCNSLVERDLEKYNLSKYPDILASVVVSAASNHYWGKEVMEFLYTHNTNIDITGNVLQRVADNLGCGIGIFETFLSKDPRLKITESTLVAVAGSHNFDSLKIIDYLFNKEPNLQITEATLVAVAGNPYTSEILEVIEYLFSKGSNIQVTEATLIAVAGNFSLNSSKVMNYLLRKQPNIQITETILAAVVRRPSFCSLEIIRSFFNREPNLQVTEEILVAAAASPVYAIDIIKYLLKEKPNTEITKSILAAAARNRFHVPNVLDFLHNTIPHLRASKTVLEEAKNTPVRRPTGVLSLEEAESDEPPFSDKKPRDLTTTGKNVGRRQIKTPTKITTQQDLSCTRVTRSQSKRVPSTISSPKTPQKKQRLDTCPLDKRSF